MKPDEHKAARSRRYQKKDGNAEAAAVAAQRRQQRQQQRQQQRPGGAGSKGKDDAEDEDEDDDEDGDEDSRGGAAFARRTVQSNTYRYRDADADEADPAKVLLQSTQELLAMLEVSAAQAIGSMVEAPSAPPDWATDAVDPTAQRLLDSLFAVDMSALGTILRELSVADRLFIDPKTRETLLRHQPALFERGDVPRVMPPRVDVPREVPPPVDAPRGVPPPVDAARGVRPHVSGPATASAEQLSAIPTATHPAASAKQPAAASTAPPATPAIVRSAEQAQLESDLDALLDL